MRDAYGKTAAQTAAIMKNLGYSLNTLVRVLDQVYGSSVTSIRAILSGLGYSVSAVASAIAAELGG